MRETSYHAVIAEMTVRALWELQNLLDCIPDALWDRCYGGAPLWQHVYHTLHELDQWFINPRDTDFVEPPIHTPHLQELHIYPAVRLDRLAIDDYFYTIKAKLSIYLTSLHDEDLLQRPDNCEWTRFTLILSQYRHLYRYMGMMMGFIEAETGLCPRTLEVGEDGMISGFRMRCSHSKLTTVRAFQSMGYDTIASGDSYNDLEMILASKAGFLFRSTDKIKADYPQLPAFETYDELLNGIKAAMA